MTHLSIVALARVIKDSVVADAIAENWKMSNDERKQLRWTVENRDSDKIHTFETVAELIATGVPRDWILGLLLSHDVDQTFYDKVASWELPEFPVNGNDLIAAGIAPGPRIGAILRGMQSEWIASKFTTTKSELLEYARMFG